MHSLSQLMSNVALVFVMLQGCDTNRGQVPRATEGTPASGTAESKLSSSVPAAGRSSAPVPSSSSPVPSPHPPGRTEGCRDGMLRITGEYCPAVVQHCVKFHQEYLDKQGNRTVSERCLEYREPSRCVSKKKKQLDFCMDRYEYPNRLGELPRVLTSWREAKNLCRQQGKRLCTEDEYNFACEGPSMLPYTNGYFRDAEKCNIDREYRQPDHSMHLFTYDRCLQNEPCRSELSRLDQRHAIGSRVTCVSWAGVVDLNGNVNEWVSLPGQVPPHRSGLKGGWWGPVRNRCRPTVKFHKEFDYGYEAGFRCCQGFGPEPEDPRYALEAYRISPEQVEAKAPRRAAPGAPPRSGTKAKPPDEPALSESPESASATPGTASAPVDASPRVTPSSSSDAAESVESPLRELQAPVVPANPDSEAGD
jgi:formylglycine-generating enzyme